MNLKEHPFSGFVSKGNQFHMFFFLQDQPLCYIHPGLFWEACPNQSFVSFFSQKNCNLLLPTCIGVPDKQIISILFTHVAFQIYLSVIFFGYIQNENVWWWSLKLIFWMRQVVSQTDFFVNFSHTNSIPGSKISYFTVQGLVDIY